MSNRLGTPSLGKLASAATGSGHAVSTTIAGQTWQAIIAAFAQWVASATVGTRQLVFQFKDSAGAVIWQSPTTAVTASQTANLSAGGGVSPASVTVGSNVNANTALPVDLALPVGATVAVVDLATIDAADTASLNVTLTN